MKYYLVFLLTLLSHLSHSQKEGNNWCFGSEAGVSFNSGKPIAFAGTGMHATYGCASISSATGKLLFYTQGSTVWDNTNSLMTNGLKLVGNSINSVQSAIIIPYPDSAHLYYIFTIPNPGTRKIAYSLINMKLRSGFGDIVTSKKNISIPTLSSGKITAVRHANRRDYWVVTPQGNTDSFHAYLVTASGLDTIPVSTKTGYKFSTVNGNSLDSMFGFFKISPDGKWIANIAKRDSAMIARFDAATGRISNVWKFKISKTLSNVGLEFSPKSNYLFVSDYNNFLYQYDLNTTTKTGFVASRKTVDSSGTFINNAGFQLAPDGKIYISQGLENHLHVIHAPDSAGSKARFQKNYIATKSPSSCLYGLPDFVQSFFQKKSFRVTQNCSRDTTFFKVSNSYQLDSVHWDFGDSTSGINNTSSNSSTPFHCYKKYGTYTVKLISFHKNFSDTIFETFMINFSNLDLGKDTSVCQSEYISIGSRDDFTRYKWNTGSTLKSIFVNNTGTYVLNVIDFDGCRYSDTVLVKNSILKSDFKILDTAQCFKNHRFSFKESSKYTNDKYGQSIWYFSDGTFSIDSSVTKKFTNPGVYYVKLVSESQFGCKDSITKTLSIYPNTAIDFSINNQTQCLNNNSFNFVNSSINVSDSLSFEWDLGDIKTTQHDFIGKKYSQTGNFTISLISISENNCKDTIAKSISILPSPKAEFFWSGACSRKNIQFTFAGNVPALPVTTSYKWYFPNKDSSDLKNPSKLLNQPGINNVTLVTKSDNGCESSITRDVEVLPQAKADFETKDVCEDSAVFFNNTSQDGNTYSWKFGDGKSSNLKSPQHQYSIAGISRSFNVNLIAFVPGGCSDSITKAVTVNANPNSDFSFSISGRLVNFTASELSATQYKWNFGDGSTFNSTTTQTSYHYTKFPFGKYPTCLTVTNAANCFSETCKEVNITGAVSSISKQSGIKIYPNPNSGIFTIDILEPKENPTLELVNQLGQIIYKVELNQASNILDLNLANGFYLVKVLDGSSVYTQKLIIQK